jgi:multidrug transporter EmrE-like cation transporter
MDVPKKLESEQSKQSVAFIAYRAVVWAACIVVIFAITDHLLWGEPLSWKHNSFLFVIVASGFFVKERSRHRPKNS